MAINGNVECEKALCGNVNKIVLQEKEVKTNCEVCPDAGYSGLSRVVVNVPTGGGGDGGIDLEDVKVSDFEVNEVFPDAFQYKLSGGGKSVWGATMLPDEITPDIIKKGKKIFNVEGTLDADGITPEGTEHIYRNGVYDITNKEYVDVQVPTGITPTGTRTLTENHKEYDVARYASAYVDVDVPTPTGTKYIDKNGTYDIASFAEATVDVKPTLQEKTVAPQTQAIRIEPSAGYYGLGAVNVAAILTEEKTITSKANAEYTPSTGKFFSKVTVDIDDEIELQERTVPVTENKTVEIEPEEGYDGLTKAIVEVNVDADIELIKASEDGESLDVSLNIGGKNAEKVYEFPSDYNKIEPSVIKKDVNILGVTGTLEDVPIEDVEVNSVVVLGGSFGGGEKLSFTLSWGEGEDEVLDYREYDISANPIVPSVIKKGTNILGVVGELEGASLDDVTVVPSSVHPVQSMPTYLSYELTDGVNTSGSKTIAMATPIVKENIKKGEIILGVEGTYEGDGVSLEAVTVEGVRVATIGGGRTLEATLRAGDKATTTLAYFNDTYAAITPDVIANGANVLGVTGTYKGEPLDKYFEGGYETINLPNATKIKKFAFYQDKELVNISMPNVTSIEQSAFNGCSNLALTSLPSGITSIGTHAFNGCSDLALTALPDGITGIPNYAFANCVSITSISLPSGIISIGENAFNGCSNLVLTELPSGVTSIGRYAFSECNKIALTSLPSSLTEMGDYAFYSSTNNASIAITEIPSSVRKIGAGAFWNCSGIKTLTFKSKPTSIGNNAFHALMNLNVPWAEGAVAGAPWGITMGKITYNYTEE